MLVVTVIFFNKIEFFIDKNGFNKLLSLQLFR